MDNLPDVVDDRENMKHMIEEMLHIPQENIIEISEATYDGLEEAQKKLKVRAHARTKILDGDTGILADKHRENVSFGVKW